MAIKTPRLSAFDLVREAGAVITVSSEDVANGYSRYNVLDPTPGRQWRSKPGWNAVTSWNNKIYFVEAGNARVGTITVGNYPTPSLWATAVQTAMNTAPGAVNTYTVTDSANVFTIARNTGVAAFDLTFTTANQDSCHLDLGFNNGTLTGLLTYVGNFAVYKSREWMKFNLLSTEHIGLGVGLVMLYNIGPIDVNPFTQPSFYATGAGGDSFTNNPLAGGDLCSTDLTTNPARAVRLVDVGSSWWRFVFDDRQAGYSYSRMGIGSIAPTLEPTRSPQQGYVEGSSPLTTVSVSETGGIFQDPKAQPKTFALLFRRLAEVDKLALEAMEAVLKIGGSFFYWDDPLNDPVAKTWYVVLTQALDYKQGVGDGPNAQRWDVSMQLRQHL